jgi:hypothetical protein
VHIETNIALDCPCCGESIYESLNWFKTTYSTCPHCDKGLAASQFSAVISDLEQSIEESVEEMVNGQPQAGGCCGKKSSCGCSA